MRLPRIRITVRRLMIAIAIVAAATWQWLAWSRQPCYRHLAGLYAAKERLAQRRGNVRAESILIEDDSGIIYRSEPGDGPFVCVSVNLDYYMEMARKYRRAARYPWLLVAPDLPEPEPGSRKPAYSLAFAPTSGQAVRIHLRDQPAEKPR